MTPSERKLNGRIGGLKVAATHDPRDYTRRARETFLAGFLAQVPTDLPLAERERRATALRRLHFAELARASALARARKARRRPAPTENRAGRQQQEATSDGQPTARM